MNALDKQNKKLKVYVNYIEQGTPEINFITKSEVKDNLEKKIKELEERNLNNEKLIDNLNQRIKELEKKTNFLKIQLMNLLKDFIMKYLEEKVMKEDFYSGQKIFMIKI